jgi:hypothetical protein
MKIVEVSFDMTQNKAKPEIEIYDIAKETDTNYCTIQTYHGGRRFFKPHVGHVVYRKPLKYSYRFITEETDKHVILKSAEMQNVIRELKDQLQDDIDHYQNWLKDTVEFYQNAYLK